MSTTDIYTLSLHVALPILELLRGGRSIDQRLRRSRRPRLRAHGSDRELRQRLGTSRRQDRKSTRLNSSHRVISYAVFCLKKKNESVSATRRTPPGMVTISC